MLMKTFRAEESEPIHRTRSPGLIQECFGWIGTGHITPDPFLMFVKIVLCFNGMTGCLWMKL